MSDYEKLKEIIDEIDILINDNVTKGTPAFTAWHTKAERFLIKRFGGDSLELSEFRKTRFAPGIYTQPSELIDGCKRGLTATKLIFSEYIKEMNEEMNEVSGSQGTQNQALYDKVFIVHGHDGELKEAIARIVEKQGVSPIILSEQANKGKTIIEKFEENSDVSGAICLFTADDLGRSKSTKDDLPRARQNVVFEAGYFMGKLGRSRVVIVAEHNVELPSDMQGIVYTDKSNWEIDVLKELKAIGYAIDLNKLF